MPVAPQPSTINAGGGGDYTSLSAWAADIPSTLTQEQDALVVGAVTEAFGIPFTGFTTTSSFKITIQGKSGSRHTGIAGSGARVLGTLGVIRGAVDYFELDWIEVYGTDGNGAFQFSRAGGTNSIKVQHSILHGASGSPISTNNASTNYIYRNTALYTSGAGRTCDFRGAGTLEVSNCLVYTQGGDFPFLADSGHVVKNTYVGGASNLCFNSGALPSGSNNAASDTTASPNFSSSINSIAGSTAFTSVTAGSEDFRTKTGFTGLTDLGATLAAVTDDCIGTSRPQGSAYDIGWIENIVAAAATTLVWVQQTADNLSRQFAMIRTGQ